MGYNGPRQYKPESLASISGLEDYSDAIEILTNLVNDLGDLRYGRWRYYRLEEHQDLSDEELRPLLVDNLKERIRHYFGTNDEPEGVE